MSEIQGAPGIEVIGLLLPAIQIITTFSAGVWVSCTQADAATALLAFMASLAVAQTKFQNGMQPA